MNEVFGKKLGQYILLEQLGEGGMAKVYNALDTRAESNVAVKVILPSKRASSVFIQQFELEAKALANLTHTNIVKVLNYGVEDGQPYLVMEYVPGGTLKEAMTHKLPWQTAAAILAPIARALDYVHNQQIVHRDVKPSNILLHGDFRPMLSDFGIMKVLEGREEKVESAIGAGIGTPEYMAPEQGMGQEVDFRADIYSLGLVYYEMITGQKPFTADSPMAIVVKHVTDELPLPTRIDKNIPKYVERVILRAVQKNPKNRYISMGHFADALELIALGDKASPQTINRISREREKRQRSFSILSLSILLVVLLLGTSIFTFNYFRQARQMDVPAVTNTIPAEVTTMPTSAALPTATEEPLTVETPTVVAPVPIADSGPSLLGTPIVSSPGGSPREIARWGIGGVNVVRWSPDGKSLALGTTSGIFLYDSQTKKQTLFIDAQFNVLALSFNLAGDEITAGSPGGLIKSWDAATGSLVQSFSYTRPRSETITSNTAVTAISYSVDGIHLAVGFKNGAINYFSSGKDTADDAFENYPAVEDLAISPDGRFIYASNGSADITVWDIQGGKIETTLSSLTPINKLSLSNNLEWMLAGGDASSVYLWNLFESKHVSSFTNLGGAVTSFDFSNDDKFVVIGLSTGEIKIFAMPAGKEEYSKTHVPLQSIKGYAEKVITVASAPDQLIVASGNHEEGLKLWDIQTGENTFTLNESRRAIEEIYFSNDGSWLASSHEGGLVRIWDVNKAQEAYPPLEGFLPKSVPFSPDNRFLAYIYPLPNNRGNVIRVVELKSGEIVAELPGYTNNLYVQFSDDSKLLVMGNPYTANIWDVATWEQLDIQGGPTAGCGQYSTPQSDLLTTISNAGIMFYPYDAKIQEMCGVKPEGAASMYYFYEQHRMLFVLGNENGDIWTWRSGTIDYNRIQSNTPYPQPRKIFLAADQASGIYAYVANGLINIKNISGANITTINRQDDYQYRVALLPNKQLMALGSRYGSIHIWALP